MVERTSFTKVRRVGVDVNRVAPTIRKGYYLLQIVAGRARAITTSDAINAAFDLADEVFVIANAGSIDLAPGTFETIEPTSNSTGRE